MTSRPLHGAPDRGAVPAADRGDRSQRSRAAIGHRDQPRRADDRRRARRRAQGEGAARAAARHSRPHQGQHRHRRQDDDDRRSLALEGVAAARRTPFVVAAAARGRRVILGKTNLSEWANFRSTHSTSGWSGRGGQVKNPVRARSQSVRLELGDRRRDRGEPRGDRRRHRDRRVDRLPVGRQRPRRHQADGRPGQPVAASFRSRTRRTRPARWRAPSPTRRCCSAR